MAVASSEWNNVVNLGILSEDGVGIESGDRFGIAPSKYLKGLVMLMQCEHDKNARRVRAELFRRFEGDNFMRPAVAQLFLESLCHGDGAEQALRRRVKIIWLGVFRAVLKIVDRGIFEDWQFFGQEGTAPGPEPQHDGQGA